MCLVKNSTPVPWLSCLHSFSPENNIHTPGDATTGQLRLHLLDTDLLEINKPVGTHDHVRS